MKILFILLISMFIGIHNSDKPIVTKDGNVTTVQMGDKVYKSAESKIGEAWSYP